MKRAFDILVALLAVPVVLPVFLVAAVAVYFTMGSPVLFAQMRGGKGGRHFRMWKLRSMTDARDVNGELLDDAQRTPPFGHFIRRYRLDELPSVYSVLKGDVSMVGPRPLIPHVRASLLGGTARQAMRPGFTGLAQVSGNTLLSDEEKIALDLYYIAHWSWTLDFEVLARTVGTVLFGEKRREALIARALAEWTPAPGAAHA